MGLSIYDNDEIEKRVINRTKVGWLRTNASARLCIDEYPLKQKKNSMGRLEDLYYFGFSTRWMVVTHLRIE